MLVLDCEQQGLGGGASHKTVSAVMHLTHECAPPAVQVQRNWMYLENIFIGSEDIRKQLPQESVLFEGVHATFQQKMKELQTVSNVVQVNNLGGKISGLRTSSARTSQLAMW